MAENASLPLSPISELMQRYQGPNLEPEYTAHKVKGQVDRGTSNSKQGARIQAAVNMLIQLGPKLGKVEKKKKKQGVKGFPEYELLDSELSTLVVNPKHSDVMFKCPGKTFLCQKAILAARSPFFDRIFKENKNSIKIEKASKLEEVDFTVAAMECVLELLYSGRGASRGGGRCQVGEGWCLLPGCWYHQPGFQGTL